VVTAQGGVTQPGWCVGESGDDDVEPVSEQCVGGLMGVHLLEEQVDVRVALAVLRNQLGQRIVECGGDRRDA
jgi:hypothetical protein